MKEEIMKRPMCPKCNKAMIWSFAIPYKEYVCFHCEIGVPMFNSQEQIEVPVDYDEQIIESDIYKNSKLIKEIK